MTQSPGARPTGVTILAVFSIGSGVLGVLGGIAALGLGAPRRVVVPCGGGGLSAGRALALKDAAITVVEPEGWDDMRRSLEASWIEPVGPNPPPTACDALQTPRVSPLTFDVLARRDATGVAVSEAETAAAQRWAAEHLRLVVEPGGAVFAVVGDRLISAQDYENAYNVAKRQKFYHGQPPEKEVEALRRELAA